MPVRPYPGAPAAADYQPQYAPQFNPGNPPPGPAAASVERGELAPVRSAESGLPFALWQGLNAEDVERLIAPLSLPVRSPALQKLWLSILAAEDDQAGNAKLASLRAEALYRSGRLEDAARVIATAANDDKNATAQVLSARIEIARGNRDDGCRAAKRAGKNRSKITKSLRGEAVVLAGYCAIVAGNKAAAGLAAELARDLSYRNRFTLAVLDAIASGRTTKRRLPKTISPLQYLLLQQAGFDQSERLIANAAPALLVAMSSDRDTPDAVRLTAAEQAARINVLDGKALADAYRRAGRDFRAGAPNGPMQRAVMFRDAEQIANPQRRTRALRALVDSARNDKLLMPVLAAIQPMVDEISPAPEISWFALTAIEANLVAGAYQSVLPWLALARSSDRVYEESLHHWQVLADIANPKTPVGQTDLLALEEMVARRRISGPVLRRLTSVLDALDYNVPIPVWDAANRAPQKDAGKLPPTGILSELLEASKQRQSAKTAFLAMRAIGDFTASEAHLIALGDSIRALRRAGFIGEAKRLAFEAVFASWPRPRGY